MKWSLVCTLFIAAISLVLLAAAPGAGKATDAPQKFNLADLADGESRTFGEGDHAIAAARRGNQVELTFKDNDGKSKKQTLHCTLGKDSCYVMTHGGKGEGHVLVLSKTAASGKDGAEVTTQMVLAGESGDEKNITVFSSNDGKGDCIITEMEPGMKWITSQVDLDDESGKVIIHGDGHELAVVTTDISETEPGTKVIRIVAEGGTVLRCPEGDATLTLKKGEEKSGPYFCPRHNLKMEASQEPVIIKEKVKMEKKPGTGDREY